MRGVRTARAGRVRSVKRAVSLCLCLAASTFALGAEGTPLQLKPASQFDAWQVALKAVLVGAMGVAAVGGGLYAWRTWKRSQGLMTGDGDAAAVEWARRVSPRTTLLVVRWQGKRYLLAESGTQTQLIDSRPHVIDSRSHEGAPL
jgi:hypothetical protein